MAQLSTSRATRVCFALAVAGIKTVPNRVDPTAGDQSHRDVPAIYRTWEEITAALLRSVLVVAMSAATPAEGMVQESTDSVSYRRHGLVHWPAVVGPVKTMTTQLVLLRGRTAAVVWRHMRVSVSVCWRRRRVSVSTCQLHWMRRRTWTVVRDELRHWWLIRLTGTGIHVDHRLPNVYVLVHPGPARQQNYMYIKKQQLLNRMSSACLQG